MQNPSQSHYTTEELFMLKPEINDAAAKGSDMHVAPASDAAIAIKYEQPIKKEFWSRYKWYIIGGGVAIIAGISWFIYKENQKNKKSA